jgi:hypothetical protein
MYQYIAIYQIPNCQITQFQNTPIVRIYEGLSLENNAPLNAETISLSKQVLMVI